MKILAIKLRALGDTVLMTAPLAELRKAYPGAEIHAAVLEPWAPLLSPHPAVDRVWPYKRHADRATRAKAVARMSLRLRRERFDCVVNFHASPSSALLAFATGAKSRSVHFHGHRDRNRFSTVEVPGKGVLKPVIERDLDAVRALGIRIPEAQGGPLPRIAVSPEEATLANERMARLGLPRPLLGLGLGASRSSKSWPVERFAELAIAWCRKTGGGAIAIAGPGEEALAHGFLSLIDSGAPAETRPRIAAEHGLGVREAAALLSTLSAYVGNDSGPKHLAIAVGAPTVTIFGPEHPFEWHPYSRESHPYLFIESLPCRRDADPGMPAWCAVEPCVAERHRCMRLIGVDQVLGECLRVARGGAP